MSTLKFFYINRIDSSKMQPKVRTLGDLNQEEPSLMSQWEICQSLHCGPMGKIPKVPSPADTGVAASLGKSSHPQGSHE